MIKLFIDAYARVGDENHVQAARAQDIPMEFFIDVLLQTRRVFVGDYNPCRDAESPGSSASPQSFRLPRA